MIQIQLNGEPLRLEICSVADLVEQQGWRGKRVAVERNGTIVPRSQHSVTVVASGDRFEIVVAVGGG